MSGAYEKFEYDTLMARIEPKSKSTSAGDTKKKLSPLPHFTLEESNKKITDLVEKIKNYELAHGRKMSITYYKSINTKVEEQITRVTMESSDLLSILHIERGIVEGTIITTDYKHTGEINCIEPHVHFNAKGVNASLKEEYLGLAKIIKESEI
ncbi:MAG: hypothetical protein NTZ02_03105 [Candidatus Woesearchaeota archaeon]|nr:hypothetical protein [Candidatus Woesearchaeota archaeon]